MFATIYMLYWLYVANYTYTLYVWLVTRFKAYIIIASINWFTELECCTYIINLYKAQLLQLLCIFNASAFRFSDI